MNRPAEFRLCDSWRWPHRNRSRTNTYRSITEIAAVLTQPGTRANITPMAADHDRLVVAGTRRYGRLPTRPAVVDPLAEYHGLARARRRLRLKEWVGFTLLHPEVHSSLILQDAHYLASSEIYVYDRAAAVLHQHSATARGGSLNLPHNLMDNSCAIDRRGYRIAYDFSLQTGRHHIKIEIAATGEAPAIVADLTLNAPRRARIVGEFAAARRADVHAQGDLSGVRDAQVSATRGRLRPRTRPRDTRRAPVAAPVPDAVGLGDVRTCRPSRRAGRGELRQPAGSAGQPEESCLWTPGASGMPGSCEALTDVASPSRPAAPGRRG